MIIDFVPKQIVWAKVQGSPWWPAEIVKIPGKDNQFYKVAFFGEDTHAFMDPKDVKKYEQNYQAFGYRNSNKKLQKSIKIADQQFKARAQTVERERQKLIKKITKGTLFVNSSRRSSSVYSAQNPVPSKKYQKLMKIKKKSKNNQHKSSSHKQSTKKEQENEAKNNKNKEEDDSDHKSSSVEVVIEDQQLLPSGKSLEDANIDKDKLEKFQEDFLGIITSMQQGKAERPDKEAQIYNVFEQYPSHHQFIKKFNANSFTPQELRKSKFIKMLTYLIKNTPSETHRTFLMKISNDIKFLVKATIVNTSQVENQGKQLSRTKSSTEQFARLIVRILVRTYQIKKQFAIGFASKMSKMIEPTRQKEFLKDLREKTIGPDIQEICSLDTAEKIGDQIATRYL